MIFRRLVTLLLLLLSLTGVPRPAQAETHFYQEKPGQVTLRSQQSLQDQAQRSWQAVLFNRYINNQQEGIFLRLVGFPGQVEVIVAQPLQFRVADQFLWNANPAMDASTLMLPNNVGQYDVQPLLEHLDSDTRLVMTVPLASGVPATIEAPADIIREWRAVTQFSPQT